MCRFVDQQTAFLFRRNEKKRKETKNNPETLKRKIELKNHRKIDEMKRKKRRGGIEPSTSQSAIECSTTELSAHLLLLRQDRISPPPSEVESWYGILQTMRSEFKHVRNLLSNIINIVLLWILQYIWTLPGFVVVLSYLYSNETCKAVGAG